MNTIDLLLLYDSTQKPYEPKAQLKTAGNQTNMRTLPVPLHLPSPNPMDLCVHFLMLGKPVPLGLAVAAAP